jgi:hypothetical protein
VTLDKEYPAWTEKLSIACSRGECGLCEWPLCNCPHHSDAASEQELRAQREHKCPRCKISKLNRCRAEDGALLEHPHTERVKLVVAAAREQIAREG